MRCVVVGAGISGLALAQALARRGVEVRVLEAEPRAGGKVRSERQDGYLVEHGPASFLDDEHGAIVQLAAEAGVADALREASPAAGRRGVVIDRRLLDVPTSPWRALTSPLLSPVAKLRCLAELALPRGRADDESVAAWARRRFGAAGAERLVYPLISGLYAGDAERISLAAAFPRLAQLERAHRSVILGALRAKRGPRTPLRSFADGMQQLTDALAAQLGPRLQRRARVLALARRADQWQITVEKNDRRDQLSADAVVLAVPAYVAAPLLAPLSGRAADAARAIEYVPVGVVHLAYTGAHPDSYGFLTAPGQPTSLLGAVFPSEIFTGRAPDGELLISARMGGARQAHLLRLSDEELITRADAELRRILDLRGPLRHATVVRHARALPQYTLGHLDRVAVIDHLERTTPGLYLTGNAYRGLGLRDCVAAAAPLAERVVRENENFALCTPSDGKTFALSTAENSKTRAYSGDSRLSH